MHSSTASMDRTHWRRGMRQAQFNYLRRQLNSGGRSGIDIGCPQLGGSFSTKRRNARRQLQIPDIHMSRSGLPIGEEMTLMSDRPPPSCISAAASFLGWMSPAHSSPEVAGVTSLASPPSCPTTTAACPYLSHSKSASSSATPSTSKLGSGGQSPTSASPVPA